MKVVSDTSPLVNLAGVGLIEQLHALFEQVLIPPAVAEEIARDARFADLLRIHSWIEVRKVQNHLAVLLLSQELDQGEAEAIVLGIEQGADLLLIDERLGRRKAQELSLRVMGVLGILMELKRRGLVTRVKPILEALRFQMGFWISEELYHRVLQMADEES